MRKTIDEHALRHIQWLVDTTENAREIITDSVDYDEDDDQEVRERLVEIRRFFGLDETSTPTESYDDLRFSELREKNAQRCEAHYHPVAAWSLTDWLTCAAGELGELASIIKNLRRLETEPQRNGHEIPIPSLLQLALGDEAADVVIYLDLLCARAGVDLGAAVRRKFNRVSRERLGSNIVLEER